MCFVYHLNVLQSKSFTKCKHCYELKVITILAGSNPSTCMLSNHKNVILNEKRNLEAGTLALKMHSVLWSANRY